MSFVLQVCQIIFNTVKPEYDTYYDMYSSRYIVRLMTRPVGSTVHCIYSAVKAVSVYVWVTSNACARNYLEQTLIIRMIQLYLILKVIPNQALLHLPYVLYAGQCFQNI